MRAARLHHYGPPENLRVEEVEPPSCDPGEVLIRVHAAAVNPVDAKMRGGSHRAVVRYDLPVTLGLDASGVIEAVGEGVTDFAVGDAVYTSPSHKRPGTYADYVAVRAEEVALKPSNLTHAEAASLPLVGLTAWGCLVDGGYLKAGDKALIQAGSGGVGSFAIQLAKHLGATVATTCSTRNVERVTELGADVVVDYTQERFEEVLEPQDLALDVFGGSEALRNLKVLRKRGHLVSITMNVPAHVKRLGPWLGVAAAGLSMAWTAIRTWFSGKRYHAVVRQASGETLREIAALVEAGAIRPVIDRHYPLEDIAEAHRHIATGHARGKIIIDLV